MLLTPIDRTLTDGMDTNVHETSCPAWATARQSCAGSHYMQGCDTSGYQRRRLGTWLTANERRRLTSSINGLVSWSFLPSFLSFPHGHNDPSSLSIPALLLDWSLHMPSFSVEYGRLVTEPQLSSCSPRSVIPPSMAEQPLTKFNLVARAKRAGA